MRERLIDLLNILMSSDKSFVNELTSRLTVTSKTIRNEVRELNALLLDSGFPEFFS
nr:HTH domain-containing protein [Liquorilactobacillus satsumensis]